MQSKKVEAAKQESVPTQAGAPKGGVLKIIAIALLALALVSALALFGPGALKSMGKNPASLSASDLPEASDFAPAISDSAVHAALEENGVEGAVIQITQGKTLVSISVPNGADVKKTAFLALGAAGALSPASNVVDVEVFFEGGKKTFSTTAASVHTLLEKSISEEEFEKQVSEN